MFLLFFLNDNVLIPQTLYIQLNKPKLQHQHLL